MRELKYESKGSDRLDDLLERAVKLAHSADVDVTDFLRDLFGDHLSVHYAWMVDDYDLDAADIWDLHHDPFDAGLKIGRAMEEGDELFVMGLGSDDLEPEVSLNASWTFWIVGKSEDEVLERVRKAVGPCLEEMRRDAGLLPFEGPSLE